MAGSQWSDIEHVLAVYFDSRGVYRQVIVWLLELRGYKRTKPAIDNKMRELRRDYGLGLPHEWDVQRVDIWLGEYLGRLGIGEHILQPTEADVNILHMVRLPSIIRGSLC